MIAAGGALGGAVVISKLISTGAVVTVAEAGVMVSIGATMGAGIVVSGYVGYYIGTQINNAFGDKISAGVDAIANFISNENGCVEIASILPGGGIAGDIKVGDFMQLSDESSLEPGNGKVAKSDRKKALGFRVKTGSGASLICSSTAPIPTREGIILAPNLLGKLIAVRHDNGGSSKTGWETVTEVAEVGVIEVQHITVGNKCFWAGEFNDKYILHHNIKAVSVSTDSSGNIWYNGQNIGQW